MAAHSRCPGAAKFPAFFTKGFFRGIFSQPFFFSNKNQPVMRFFDRSCCL